MIMNYDIPEFQRIFHVEISYGINGRVDTKVNLIEQMLVSNS